MISLRANVREQRTGADVRHRLSSRKETVCRNNNFVPRTDAGALKGQFKRGRPRTNGDSEPCAHVLGKLPLESLNPLATNELAAFEDLVKRGANLGLD